MWPHRVCWDSVHMPGYKPQEVPKNISYYYFRNVRRPEKVPFSVSGFSFFFCPMGDCTKYSLLALTVLRSLRINVE